MRFIAPLTVTNNNKQQFLPPYLGQQRRIESILVQSLSNIASGSFSIGNQSVDPIFTIGDGTNNVLRLGQFQLVQPQLWLPNDTLFCTPRLAAPAAAIAPSGGGATFAGAPGVTATVPITSAVPQGDILIVATRVTLSATFTSLVDSKGNAYTKLTDTLNATSGVRVALWQATMTQGLTTADTLSLTTSVSANVSVAAQSFTGSSGADYDLAGTTGNSATASMTANGVSTGDLVIAASVAGGVNTLAAGSPFTAFNANGDVMCAAYYVAEPGGAITFSSTFATGQWAAVIGALTANPSQGFTATLAVAGTELPV